jgi:hypothetical protein
MFGKQLSWPTEYKCDLLSHFTLCILFCHFIQIAHRVQKIDRSTRDLIFGKMKGGVNKEEAERLSQLERNR